MNDHLLDEATRLADDWRATREGDVLRALVERVRVAEAALVSAIAGTYAEDERMLRRDAERAEEVVRGELDAVRALVTEQPGKPHLCMECWTCEDVLAIIDAEGSTRPQDATEG